MLASIRRFALLSTLAGLTLTVAQVVSADCLPVAYKRYVGNTTTDNQCTDNDIQSAINISACPTTIYVSNERAWTGQHLDINNRNITIVGRSGGCGPQACDGGGCIVPDIPEVIVDGVGHSGDSVMYIHGSSNVTLKSLDIRNGTNINGAANTYGGGIHFDGNGSLVLDTVWVRNNSARYGGGINFNGNGGFAGMTVLANTRVLNNTAVNSGGGVRVTGNAFMSMLYDNTAVWFNHAPNGFGGGINVVGPARVDLASPGQSNVGVIYSNDAKNGGGIAVTSGSSNNEDASLQLYTVDPARPVRIQGNFASSSGGGIYLKSYIGFPPALNYAAVCAFDFRIDFNAAPEGSAIHADSDSDFTGPWGSYAFLNQTNSRCAGIPAFAQRCESGIPCNEFASNASVDAAGNATLGATLFTSDDSRLVGDRFAMSANQGGYAIRATTGFDASNCLLTGNDVSRQLLRGEGGSTGINSCTIADNTILSTNSIYVGGSLTLADSIIDQPGNNALGYGGNPNDLVVSYVLSSDVSTLPAIQGVALGRPTYVNASGGNYRLALNSLGIDFAPPIVGDDRDLDNNPHDQDLQEVGNLYGVRDLGAYERQRSCGTNDTIYCDGFESP
jgi:hypothetical protein